MSEKNTDLQFQKFIDLLKSGKDLEALKILQQKIEGEWNLFDILTDEKTRASIDCLLFQSIFCECPQTFDFMKLGIEDSYFSPETMFHVEEIIEKGYRTEKTMYHVREKMDEWEVDYDSELLKFGESEVRIIDKKLYAILKSETLQKDSLNFMTSRSQEGTMHKTTVDIPDAIEDFRKYPNHIFLCYDASE